MAKNGKVKIPKKIGGVKVPKMLRKNQIATLIDTPLGREILADAIVAAATAAAAALVKKRPSARQIADASEAVVDAGGDAAAATRDTVQGAAGAVAGLVREAAQQFLPTSLGGREDEPRRKNKDRSYAHLADQDRKGKKDKNRTKPSKH